MAKKKPDMLSVLPNPHHALDHEDEPHAACLKENAIDQFIGAMVDLDRSKSEGRVCFTFSADPEIVPASPYYIRKLRDGDLLPADEATAARATIEYSAKAHAQLKAFASPSAEVPAPALPDHPHDAPATSAS